MADTSKVTIEEQAGKKRKLELVGPGQPFRGAPWGVEQRMVTDAVPGNADDAIQQVLGPIDTPSTWEGMWRTTRLAARPALYSENGGAPQKVALAFTLWTIVDDMTRAGQLCRVVWAVGTKKVERLGRIATFTPQPDLITDVAWSLEWQWVGRGPARQSVAKFRSDSKAALAKSVQLELGQLTAEIEAAKIVTKSQDLPGTADSFSLGDLEALLEAPKDLLAAFTTPIKQLAGRIEQVGKLIEQAERLPADLASQAVDAATAVVNACASFDQAVSVRGPEVYTSFDTSSSVRNLLQAQKYFGDAQSRSESAMQLAAELRLAAKKAAKQGPGQEGPSGSAMPDVLAVVFAKQGDTFAGLSARFYEGNPDYGPAIAKANKFAAYAIAPLPGTILVIPNAAIAKDMAA
jgi:hypothetical protein